jgi:hypothetical protein
MPCHRLPCLIVALASTMWVPHAGAQQFSTVASSPTAMPANGVIAGDYPSSRGEPAYYFAVDLKAGNLATQAWVKGANAAKHIVVDLLDETGGKVTGFAVDSYVDDDDDTARNIAINHSGRYLVRLTTRGPELATYRVEFGGTAFVGHQPAPLDASEFSHAFLDPTHLGANGTITGTFPATTRTTSYYFDADLKAGVLMTQMSMAAPKDLGGTKWWRWRFSALMERGPKAPNWSAPSPPTARAPTISRSTIPVTTSSASTSRAPKVPSTRSNSAATR